jgi:hypothetical protein
MHEARDELIIVHRNGVTREIRYDEVIFVIIAFQTRVRETEKGQLLITRKGRR